MSRRPILPFVTEFKNRSPRASAGSSAPRSSKAASAADDEAKQSFLDPGKFFEERSWKDGVRDDAMRAADAIFSFNKAEASDDTAAPPTTPKGRVLPSLIDAEDELTVRLREAEQKRHRRPRVKKSTPASSGKKQRPSRKPVSAPAPQAEPIAASIDLKRQIVAAGPRERRSIQKRWVLKTELKPGEAWKRRLHKAAR